MRKLMWFTVGFCAAAAVGIYLLWEAGAVVLCIAAAIIALCLFALSRKTSIILKCTAVMLGICAGFAFFTIIRAVYFSPVKAFDDEVISGTIISDGYSSETAYGCQTEGRIELDGRSYRIRVYLHEGIQVCPGDEITGSFRIRATIPGGQKESTYYQGKGIFLLGSQKDEVLIQHPQKVSLKYYPAVLAHKVKTILKACFEEDIFPVAQAILLGDTSELAYETDTWFKISGIRHIIAVSGLHVGFIYAIVSYITRRNRWLTALIGIPVLLLFAAIAGFTPSVTRASIMVGLMMIANLLDKEYDSASELSFACLVMVIINPFIITSVSFQLSVASVAGILLFQPRIYAFFSEKAKPKGLLYRIYQGVTGSISVTVGAMSLTIPLTAYYFGSVSIAAVITNILTLWAVGIIFGGMLLVILSGCVSIFFGKSIAWAIGWLIRYVTAAARLISAFPYAAVYTKSVYIVFWIILCYLLVAEYIYRRKGRMLFRSAIAAVSLAVCIFLSWYTPRKDDCRASVMDVGQGQCVLIQCDGQNFLVDCGGNSEAATADEAAEQLLSQSIRHLDGILLSHLDRDHICGLNNLLTRIDADVLYLPEEGEEEMSAQFREGNDVTIRYVHSLDEVPLGKGKLTLYQPPKGKSKNEKSISVLFERDNCAILITGDQNISGEKALVEELAPPEIDLLVVGHHGSKNSAGEEFLQAISPQYAVISVGTGNSYGHPAAETLDRLKSAGCKVYRTDKDGTVIYRRRGHGPETGKGQRIPGTETFPEK